jgi:hypothetical protein
MDSNETRFRNGASVSRGGLFLGGSAILQLQTNESDNVAHLPVAEA